VTLPTWTPPPVWSPSAAREHLGGVHMMAEFGHSVLFANGVDR
jgi:hypothetical protein